MHRKSYELPPLLIGEKKAPVPLVQGGMGVGISLSGLASAVANEGGVGVIATAGIGFLEPDFFQNFLDANRVALKKQIRETKQKIEKFFESIQNTRKGLVGVNIMVALSNFADMVQTAIKERADVIFSGAGLPLDLPKHKIDSGLHDTMLVPIVSSGRTASVIMQRWNKRYSYPPDAFVVEGPKAGGHLGYKPEHIDDASFVLEKLVPEVIQAVNGVRNNAGHIIPVIAAGGIYTGADIYSMMHDYGSSGVQMATRFVATHECDASDKFKQAYIEAQEKDIRIIKSPVGLPGRALDNEFLRKVDRGEKHPYNCPYHCITTCDYKNSPYCIAHALLNAQKGQFNGGFAFAGSNVYRIDKIMSVHELVDELLAGYVEEAQRRETA